MIKQILDFLIQFWAYLRFWDILNQEDVGVIRCNGLVQRDMRPGWNWRLPIFESAVIFDGREGTYVLDPQSLITADGKARVLRLKVTCQVIDARAHLLNVYDPHNNIQDVAAGELGDAVRAALAAEVDSGAVLKRVSRRTQACGRKWGMKITDVQFLECSSARSFRLWQNTFAATGQE